MDLREAAEQLGVHYQTAYRWVRNGSLTATKLGTAYQLSDAEVARFLAKRLAPTPPPKQTNVRDWDLQADRLRTSWLGRPTSGRWWAVPAGRCWRWWRRPARRLPTRRPGDAGTSPAGSRPAGPGAPATLTGTARALPRGSGPSPPPARACATPRTAPRPGWSGTAGHSLNARSARACLCPWRR